MRMRASFSKTMASCVVRKLARIASRTISQRSKYLNCHNVQIRRINTSTIVLQKYFSKEHEWVDVPDNGTVATIGITDFAQDKLGDVVFVSLPETDTEVEAEGEVGVLESVKAASDLYSPLTGTVTEVNEKVTDNPGLINSSPYEQGWLFKIAFTMPEELEKLMNEDKYKEFVEDQE